MVHARQVAPENQQARQDDVPDGAGPTTRHPGSPRPSTVRPSTTGSVGLLLAGRYRLEERRGRDGDSSAWDGHDEQLDRRVLVRVVSGTAVAPTLVAARAAVLHLDPALARILDTGSARATDGTLLAWVVEERPSGQRLGDLVRERALDADDARAVVAGAAAALARAASVGHHHRRLGPASLYVDGQHVVVSGLLVAAAAAGLEGVEHERAEREDAVGLVCLLYAALSGLWPYARLESLGAAPRARGGAVPLRDLAPSTPADLDSLAAQTLGPLDGGPLSPADLVVRLLPAEAATPDGRTAGPGQEVAVAGASSRQVVLPATPPPPRVGPAAPAALAAGPRTPAVGPPAAQTTPATPTTRTLPTEAVTPSPAASGPAAAVRAVRSPRRAARAARGSAHETPAASTAPQGADATQELTAVGAQDRERSDEAPRAGRRGAERAAAVTGGAREAFDRSRARARAAAAVAVSGREELRVGTGEQEALPLLRPPAASRRSISHLDRVTAGVVAAVVVVLLVVAVAVAWRQLPSLSALTSSIPGLGSGPTASGPPSAAAPPPAPGAPAPPPPAAGAAPVVTGVRALDPGGDGQENDGRLPALLDGDPATSWSSETYATSSFGDLKPGVGVVLDLASGATVSAVELGAAGTGGTVEVRTSPDGSLDGSTVVASATLGSEGAPTTITLDTPVETAHLVLWMTRLPSTPDGFRAEISGVALR